MWKNKISIQIVDFNSYWFYGQQDSVQSPSLISSPDHVFPVTNKNSLQMYKQIFLNYVNYWQRIFA